MLKFFRKYNKWILVFGGVLLMIVFLLPSGGQMFAPNPTKQPIGEVDGRTITFGDQRQAAGELSVLEILGRRSLRNERLFTTFTGLDDPLAWILALHEAEQLGLSASNPEARQVMGAIGLDETALVQLRASNGLTEDMIVQTLRNWLIVQRYRELALGMGHLSPVERLERISGVLQLVQQLGPQYMSYAGVVDAMLLSAQGVPRLSEPLAKHVVAGNMSRARVAFVPVPASIRAAKVADAPLDSQLVEAIYETYRDVLPGQGLPAEEVEVSGDAESQASADSVVVRRTYPFGYRTPDRVKIEYLMLDFDQLLAKAEVDFAEAMAYYNENRGEFMADAATPEGEEGAEGGAATTPRPFAEVRPEIMRRLRQEKAADLGQRILQQARATLMEQVRQFPDNSGYKRLPEDWSPMPLGEVAASLQEQFGVPVQVRRIDNQWLDREALAGLEGIGRSIIATDDPRQGMAPFVTYVFSAETFEPDPTNALGRFLLQEKLPSLMMTDFGGDLYLFRLIEAEKTRAPESIEEVRSQVEADARRVLAYRELLGERDAWAAKLETQALEAIAEEAGVSVQRPEPFPRGSRLAAPRVEGVGVSRPFVDAVFEVAERFETPVALKAAPREARSTLVGLDQQLALAVVRVDDYMPIPRSEYLAAVAEPAARAQIYAQLVGNRVGDSPLSLDALIERTGFVYSGERGRDEEESDEQGGSDETPPQS